MSHEPFVYRRKASERGTYALVHYCFCGCGKFAPYGRKVFLTDRRPGEWFYSAECEARYDATV